jgi:hypothetical protein
MTVIGKLAYREHHELPTADSLWIHIEVLCIAVGIGVGS